MENDMHSFVHTNIRVFYNIAQEAYMAMNENLNSRMKPKPKDEPGYVITYDPEQKSLENAFITIVFCGIFLESLLHLLIVKRKGIKLFKDYDCKPYEDKLQLLGCYDKSILEGCKLYRKARKEIVHEKAHIDNKNIRIAQKEATSAIKLIQKIITYFDLEMD